MAVSEEVRAIEFTGAIAEYKRKHGIYTYERNGVIYECAPDWNRTIQSFQDEAKDRRRAAAANAALDAHIAAAEVNA